MKGKEGKQGPLHQQQQQQQQPPLSFELVLFMVDGGEGSTQYDSVQKQLMENVHVAYILPANHMGACAQAIRSAELVIFF